MISYMMSHIFHHVTNVWQTFVYLYLLQWLYDILQIYDIIYDIRLDIIYDIINSMYDII